MKAYQKPIPNYQDISTAITAMVYANILGAIVGATWLSFHYIKQRLCNKQMIKTQSCLPRWWFPLRFLKANGRMIL